MDLAEIRKLVRLMLRAELTELEIDDTAKGLRVHLKREGSGRGTDALMQPVVQVMGGGATHAPGPGMGGGHGLPLEVDEDELPAGTVPFESPMVGTFYRSPSPDSDPFVETGDKITEDSVICIVEAMKVMNEIKAELRGEVVDILVENGEPVEYGQPLFLIKRA